MKGWRVGRDNEVLQFFCRSADFYGMTIHSHANAPRPESAVPRPDSHGDISVEILKKSRQTRNLEANAIVDRLPETKPAPGKLKSVDAYA